MENTKERILYAALKLFASDGYEATSVSSIAGMLGMTKGALYRHYQNKQDILTSILERMEEKDAGQARAFSLPEGTRETMPQAYRQITLQQLMAFSRAQFAYWTQDPVAELFRKMLTLEQYRNEEMKKLYHRYFSDGPLGYTTDLLCSLGCKQAQQLALRFYAPMLLLYALHDQKNPQTSSLMEQHFTAMEAILTEEIGK